MHTRDRLPLDALLLRRPKQNQATDTAVVLPAYHAFALCVCLLFFLQAVAWLMPPEAPCALVRIMEGMDSHLSRSSPSQTTSCPAHCIRCALLST